MVEPTIRFDDGAAYERMMGAWSRSVGEIFLDWVSPGSGLRWVDVGCGNGAFTELLVERCAPIEVQGIDPSDAQLAFARTRRAARIAEFRKGDAMALPFSKGSFDAAVMALVIFFVPDPAKGVAELVRVVRRGGTVSTYAWDVLNGGSPSEPIQAEIRAMGIATLLPPSASASRMEELRNLWTNAGLGAIETRVISVQRTFADFDDFWATNLLGSSVRPTIAAMSSGEVEQLKRRMRARLLPDAAGRITHGARANAIKGCAPT